MKIPENGNPDFIIDLDNFDDYIDFNREVFSREAPLHIEIGSGRGTFLVSQSQAFPDINYIGIEWARKYYRHAADRIARWGLSNVRMLRTDAAWFMREHIADNTVDCYHIYFPDPWPKARHNKRRLICDDNLPEFIRTLKSGGTMNIATDHLDYFEQMQRVLLNPKVKELCEIDFVRAAGAKDGEMAGTNFERKYLVEGRVTNTIAVKVVK